MDETNSIKHVPTWIWIIIVVLISIILFGTILLFNTGEDTLTKSSNDQINGDNQSHSLSEKEGGNQVMNKDEAKMISCGTSLSIDDGTSKESDDCINDAFISCDLASIIYTSENTNGVLTVEEKNNDGCLISYEFNSQGIKCAFPLTQLFQIGDARTMANILAFEHLGFSAGKSYTYKSGDENVPCSFYDLEPSEKSSENTPQEGIVKESTNDISELSDCYNQENTDSCISGLAIQNKNINWCFKIDDAVKKDSCAYYVVLKTRVLSDCDLIDNYEQNQDCIYKIATYTNNVEICENLDDSEKDNACVHQIAVWLRDETLCDNIEDTIQQDDCIIRIAERKQDTSLCDTLNDNSRKDECLELKPAS